MHERDVAAFSERAPDYESGWRGRLHHDSADKAADQQAGLRQCHRVLVPGGRLVLIDLFSAWLVPTLLAGRPGKARTKWRASRLLADAGFPAPQWHDLYAVIIRAAVAAR